MLNEINRDSRVCYKLSIVVAVGSTSGEETVKVDSMEDVAWYTY